MNYLLSLIGTLSNDERGQILLSDIKGRERELLEAAIQASAKKLPEEAFAPEKLGLTRSHFDKINSVLIKKIFGILTDGSFYQVAELLKNRGLTSLLLHQVELENRRLKTADKQAKKLFYHTTFETLRKMPLDDSWNIKILRKYADLLKPLLDKSDVDTPLGIDLKYTFILNSYHFFNTGITYREQALKNIEQLMPNPEKYKGRPEYTYHYFNLTIHYRDFRSEHKKAIGFINIAIDNAHKCALKNDPAYMAPLYGVLATTLCQDSQFDTSVKAYQQAFRQYPDVLDKSFYHNYLFSCAMVINAQYDQAKQHITKYLEPMLNSPAALYFRFDIIRLYALYYMHTDDMPKAFEYMQLALGIKRKQMTDSGDMMYRMVENLYFLLVQDYQLAQSLASKNQRFLQRKGYTLDNSDYMHLFYACGELAKMKLKGKVDKAKIADSITRCQRGILKLFGGLFDKVK